MNPVNWWHRQEGGKIAEQRPAPPGADQAYPNIATVPPKPEAPNADELKKLTDSLVADRTNAQHAAQSAPLADPSSPTASPSLFGVGTAPPPPPRSVNQPTASGSPGAPGASASMAAVNAPAGAGAEVNAPAGAATAVNASPAAVPAVNASPAAGTPPSAAPRKAVQSEPLGAPSGAAPAAANTPADVAAVDAGAQPALPAGPPTRPSAAPSAPPVPVAVAPMPAPSAGPSATIVFLEGASTLSTPAADEVKAFAAKRGNGTIAITGYGDSSASDPDAQSAGVNLGLSRAQAIVETLKAAGVPGTAIRVSAEASGRGAALHLLQQSDSAPPIGKN